MARGNPFWSKARGKLGDVVLQTRYGEQIVCAYQPKVHNPRTPAQQIQRIKFAAAVKAFKQFGANLFPWAFEDRKPNESWFNAFMRHNVDRATLIDRDLYLMPNFFSFGDWLLSEGSLGILQPSVNDILMLDNQYCLNPFFGLTFDDDAVSFGEVSRQLISKMGFSNGDLITVVIIPYQESDILYMPASMSLPRVYIVQYVINIEAKGMIYDESPWIDDDSVLYTGDVKSNFAGTNNELSVHFVFTNGRKCFPALINHNADFELREPFLPIYGFIRSRKDSEGKMLCSTSPIFYFQTDIDSFTYYKSLSKNLSSLLPTWDASKNAVVNGGLISGY